MKRSYVLMVATGLLVAGLSSAALAQRGGPGRAGAPGGFGGPGGFGSSLMFLLQNDAVKKEIELLDDQSASIEKLAEEMRSKREERPRVDFRNLSEQEQEKAYAEMRVRREKEATAANAKLAEILLPHQLKRLREISVQLRGTRALTDAEVATQLKLSDAQKQKLEDVMRQNSEAVWKLFREGNRDEAMAKMEALRKEGEQKVLAVLTPDQKAQFEKLKGEPFKMPEGGFSRGGFGSRRGEGGRPEGAGNRPERGGDRPARKPN